MNNTGTSDKPEYPNLGTDATLMADITFSLAENGKSNWTTVGYYDLVPDVHYYYAGTFDGNGYTISGLTIISENTDDEGMLKCVGKNGSVKKPYIK